MSTRYVRIDRETPRSLPPDLREWLPEGHWVHIVVETVDGLTREGFQVNGGAVHPEPRRYRAVRISAVLRSKTF